ncbi:potassium/sodium efflux P-type ATPase, fungal-type [Spizellomyces punctatus DAOM BR117]|uniref:Potassium/sodium efflux P-type ATPase, fungal-type n=1 Tax=Spizellomyces punctatus (strain DAOM BR117) TaxID=645134 RepID=A0A0L0H592_SPIPD|nr:potassium/sodium efflux P-type ATPase, fungal-type [Spizellomyces punctatus DAOM BR117]KNC95903.1 potassium/sodium efflux P-type ATPase, fungal-type [Spizellomyces punctatus DAOM BR117]|eukprot:XP_016603943.1 potassium/sodium efflux P-type ATPase, fungal-type [Spizellomyces punctatus DAOM BR117]
MLKDLRRTNTSETSLIPHAHHTLAPSQSLLSLGVTSQGLTTPQITARRQECGANILVGSGGVRAWKVLIGQVCNGLTVVLVAAMSIALAIQDWLEAAVILFVIVFNTIVGFLQEYRAEKTMEALQKTASPTSRVLRNGQTETIASEDLVPGDILFLEQGDAVGADARLIEVYNLQVEEGLLTGESLPVSKSVDAVEMDTALGDRLCMVYMGTNVVKGRAKAVVVATGMQTQIGSIAKSLSESSEPTSTPLQKRLNHLALALFVFSIILALIVFAVYGFVFSQEASIYAISVAIAMIPEGLVAVVTLTMALGVRRMAKQKAIVRRLAALEALGSTTDICSDKTGTLTQGKMVLTQFYVPHKETYTVTGTGLDPTGTIQSEDHTSIITETLPDYLTRFVQCAALCNTSAIHMDEEGIWNGTGDPTEIALQVFAHKLSSGKPALLRTPDAPTHPWTLIAEHAFDSTLKRMSVVYMHEPTNTAYVFAKGGLESLIPLCKSLWDETPLTEHIRAEITGKVNDMASRGLRVLCLAYRRLGSTPSTRDATEKDLMLLGWAGINDPPRPETASAVQACHRAGITVRMLTGDHPRTAAAIAEQVGILDMSGSHTTVCMDAVESKRAWTGPEFDALTSDQVDALPELPLVVARCTPDTKVRMIDALDRRKKIAAMTGDGVNDSPSLKKAPIGIAMGTGSDVAKQASSIVLTDDNFATIVSAIAQGRRIFSNIQKFVLHLMTTNVAEIVALIIGLAFVDGSGTSVYPLSPLQILFVNMVTSSPPAMALGIEPPQPTQMSHAYTPTLFSRNMIFDITYYGLTMGSLTLAVFILRIFAFGNGLGHGCNLYHDDDDSIAGCRDVYRARATAFVTLTWTILIHAYVCRHRTQSTFHGWKTNKALAYCCLFGMVIVVPALYIPGTQYVFRHEGIGWEWGMVVVACLVYIASAEGYKFLWRVWMRRRGQNEIVEAHEEMKMVGDA